MENIDVGNEIIFDENYQPTKIDCIRKNAKKPILISHQQTQNRARN